MGEDDVFNLAPVKIEGDIYLPMFPAIQEFLNSSPTNNALAKDIQKLLSNWSDQERYIRVLDLKEKLKGYDPDELHEAVDLLKVEKGKF